MMIDMIKPKYTEEFTSFFISNSVRVLLKLPYN